MRAEYDDTYSDGRQLSLLPEDEYPDYPSDVPADDTVRPINWNILTADEADFAWRDLDKWVKFIKNTYGLPPTVVPPYWHRHDELVWELSALHLHWQNSYDPDGSPSAPLVWHRDFAEARNRLREWVASCGTRLDRDRPTRQTAWPGELPYVSEPEGLIVDRDEDFAAFVLDDLNARLPDNVNVDPELAFWED